MNYETLARRLERSEAAHWGSLMAGLSPDYGAEVRHFGPLTALRCPGMAERSFVNRIIGVVDGCEDELTSALRWMRDAGVPVRVDVCPVLGNELLLRRLSRDGLSALGFQSALFLVHSSARPVVGSVEVRLADGEESFAFAAKALAVCFEETDPTWVRWLTDSMWATFGRPDWFTYVAYCDGEPAGFAQLHLADGVGSLALAGTLPAFRGRGVQTALIHRRIADAAAAGCDLIAGQTGNGTGSQRNMERAGLRLAYTKAEFYQRPD